MSGRMDRGGRINMEVAKGVWMLLLQCVLMVKCRIFCGNSSRRWCLEHMSRCRNRVGRSCQKKKEHQSYAEFICERAAVLKQVKIKCCHSRVYNPKIESTLYTEMFSMKELVQKFVLFRVAICIQSEFP